MQVTAHLGLVWRLHSGRRPAREIFKTTKFQFCERRVRSLTRKMRLISHAPAALVVGKRGVRLLLPTSGVAKNRHCQLLELDSQDTSLWLVLGKSMALVLLFEFRRKSQEELDRAQIAW